ncbi:cation-dependent mannose-6-phosphate receptor [Centroberyx affinis]|uniref:cation-dependent mannose-6-phosphate receptor n=1 Tax=Centroberyx affinis TaxID=166261 RepID=UPI003A5BA0B8
MKVLNRPTGVAFLLWTLAVELVLCESGAHVSNNTNNCKLFVDSKSERKALSRLEPLTNHNFTAQTKNGDESYTYVFQLCGDAGGIQGAGVIQLDKSQKPTIVGRYDSTQAIGGSDWVMLMYRNGDSYDEHCSKEKRKAIVMISCNRNTDMSQLEVVLEDRDKAQECFYLFELDSSAVCPALPSQQLSTGSIILIIGVCLLAVYLIGGFLYQRLVVGAKGMEQFPNYAFWVEVGNLTADGCDFVCRSRSREEAPTYRGVVTESLEDEPEERDDHLLPM